MEIAARSKQSQDDSPNGLLLYFIADVLRRGELLERFLRDPDGVVSEYDLNSEQIGALFSMNAAVIAGVVQLEVAANVRRATSFDYPVPEVSIDDISPSRIHRDMQAALTLTGEALMSRASVFFTNRVNQRQFSFQAEGGIGPFQKRRLQVQVILPEGEYVVSLRNSPEASPVTAQGKLTVE